MEFACILGSETNKTTGVEEASSSGKTGLCMKDIGETTWLMVEGGWCTPMGTSTKESEFADWLRATALMYTLTAPLM